MKTLICILAIFVGVVFATVNALKLDGARSYAARSAKGLKTLESAVSNIQLFHEKNGQYPTDWQMNCAGYKFVEYRKGVCIETISLQAVDGEQNFVVTYKSPGMYFSGKIGSGPKREYRYDTATQFFNYSHADTYAEVLAWRLGKFLIGLLLIFLPIMHLRRRSR